VPEGTPKEAAHGRTAIVTGTIAAAAFVAGIALWASASFAASGTLIVSNGVAPPGGEGTVEIIANVSEPGLGAWTIDIQYDNTVVLATACGKFAGSVCSPAYAEDMGRVTGASKDGYAGETLLATFTFECLAEGESPLTLIAGDEDHPFADADPKGPEPVDPLEVIDGVFICTFDTPTSGPPDGTPDDTPDGATGTPQPGALPDTGSGTTSTARSDTVGYLAAALAAAGFVSIAAYAALRLRISR
jgi:hypothetical protein